MSIRPVDFGGMIQRTDDVGAVKHHQDQKHVTEQQNIQQQVKQESQQKARQVHHADNSRMGNGGFDAKEKGKNQYFKREKKKDFSGQKEGAVVKKQFAHGIDIKI